jgi:hypothetical protein
MVELRSSRSTAGGYRASLESAEWSGDDRDAGVVAPCRPPADVSERSVTAGFVAQARTSPKAGKRDPVRPPKTQRRWWTDRWTRPPATWAGSWTKCCGGSGDEGGAIGFSRGGGLALVLATRRPDAAAAVVPCDDIIPQPDAQPVRRGCRPRYWVTTRGGQFLHAGGRERVGGELRGWRKSVGIVFSSGAYPPGLSLDSRPRRATRRRAAWDCTSAFFTEHLASDAVRRRDAPLSRRANPPTSTTHARSAALTSRSRSAGRSRPAQPRKGAKARLLALGHVRTIP